MTQKEPTTLLGRCTTLANGDGHLKDTIEIKLIQDQTQQQELLVHIISILNVT